VRTKKNIYNIKISNNELIKIIIDRYNKKIPTSVIRKSDGENIIIGYKKVKGIKARKFFKKLRHFNISYLNFQFQIFFRDELVNSYYNADYIGVPIKNHYYGYTSSVRKFELDITNHYKFNTDIYVDNHYQLEFLKIPNENKLKNSIAQSLISDKKIGLISHFNLNSFFQEFNSEVVSQISIPKRDSRSFFIKMNKKNFMRVINYIKHNNQNVDIWFLGAGAYAKPFCNYIKKMGGIGIDLGSIVDTWANEYHSRKFLRNNSWKNE